MSFDPGTRLGSYEIAALIGAGGMGQVYRAIDTNLKRAVAIKVLPPIVATDEGLLARLRREAELLASLSHPNIAVVHGLERTAGATALVMELIQGPTLEDRLIRGRIPTEEALAIARQVADGLDAAHERGIVHRDLKPANIKIRPDGVVKVLDFGLAKALEPIGSPNASPALTEVRTILGTAAYMSPEQARGESVDKRTDIWAFGCVLYEMLAGRRVFEGNDAVEVLGRVLERTPDWDALGDIPAPVQRVIHRCLEKQPRHRLRDIGDARADLDEPAAGPVGEPRRHIVGLVPISIAAAALGAAVWAGWWLGTSGFSAREPPVERFLIDVRPAAALLGGSPFERTAYGRSRPSRTALALSPNGRSIAFTAQRDGQEALYLRSFDKDAAELMPGTEGADGPFFSPDGRWLGFWSRGALRRVPVAGGPPVEITRTPQPSSSSWSDDGRILFGLAGLISSVPFIGGEPTALTTQSGDQIEFAHLHPRILPGGKWLLYTILPVNYGWDKARVVARSLLTGEQRTLVEGASDARYVPTGHLLYMRLGNLMAAPFDLDAIEITGGEVGVVQGIMHSVNTGAIPLDTGSGQYTVAGDGTLAFVAGAPAQDFVGTLVWMYRDGTREPIPAPKRPYFAPRLSPDERSIAVGTFSLFGQDLWRYDLTEGALTRLTFAGRIEHPVWSPTANVIAVGFSEIGPYNVFTVPADGSAAPTRLTRGPRVQFPGAWTPDGRSLVFYDSTDISVVSLDQKGTAQPLLTTPFAERMPDLSPDGRWLAYVADETGQQEVYVQAFPGLGAKRRISADGGVEPAWSRDGRKLFYVVHPASGLERMMEVDVTLGATFTAGTPRTLFEFAYSGAISARAYDATRDGERFLFVEEAHPPNSEALDEIHVVQNWFTELERLAPRSN
jgi:Tol biopolymer transport system component